MIVKKFEKSNREIAFNVLSAKKEKIYCAYVWKHNSNFEKQIILLMIQNGEKREQLNTLATWAKFNG